MTKHFKYGGSTAARTLACPAWIRLSASIPKNHGSNEAADTGTLLHNCMEEWLKGDMPLTDLLAGGREYKGIKLTSDLLHDKLVPAVSALTEVLQGAFKGVLTEPLVKISDDTGGSIDVLAKSADGKTVHIIDYKFGHVPVSAEDNAQLLFYALAADIDPATKSFFGDCDTVAMTIIQPNENGPDFETWTQPYEALTDFEDKLFDAIDLSKQEDCAPTAGPHCTYCPAMATCPIKTGEAAVALRITDLDKLGQLSAAMAMVESVEKWAKAVKKQAHEQMEQGVKVDGFKLVAKRAMRVWNEPEVIEGKVRRMRRILIEEAFDMKFKTPPQLEKLCKEKGIDFKEFTPYICSVSSGTTVAKESDKRSEVIALDGLEAMTKMLS
jgi:hypothetical protein